MSKQITQCIKGIATFIFNPVSIGFLIGVIFFGFSIVEFSTLLNEISYPFIGYDTPKMGITAKCIYILKSAAVKDLIFSFCIWSFTWWAYVCINNKEKESIAYTLLMLSITCLSSLILLFLYTQPHELHLYRAVFEYFVFLLGVKVLKNIPTSALTRHGFLIFFFIEYMFFMLIPANIYRDAKLSFLISPINYIMIFVGLGIAVRIVYPLWQEMKDRD
ncbi:MAG: hypothetical protein ABI597_12535 [Gammaproteobacteria bacterium]